MAAILLAIVFFGCTAISTIVYHLTVPLSDSLSVPGLIAFDLLIAVLALPLLHHCRRTLGRQQGLLFFFSAAMFMGCQETVWILLGKLNLLGESYAFTTGFLWFFFAPFNVCLGWFMVCYACYRLASWSLPRSSTPAVAALSGLIALSVDLWLDPAATNIGAVLNLPNLWNWAKTVEPTLFSIPFTNFWGWFLTVAIFTFVFDFSRKRASEGRIPPGAFFGRLGLGFGVVIFGVKPLQKLLEAVAPGFDLLPLVYEPGLRPGPFSYLLIALVPALMLICLVAYVTKARKDEMRRKDIWFLTGYALYSGINLGIAGAVCLAFPGSALIFIVPMTGWIPWGLLLRHLLHRSDTVLPGDR